MERKAARIPETHNKLRNPKRTSKKSKAAVVDNRCKSGPAMDAPNAVVTDPPKCSTDISLITGILDRLFIFSSLSKAQRRDVILSMKHFALCPGQIVFEQGQPGINFFIVASGELEIIVDCERKNTVKSGEYFAELALIHDMPRSATVRTLTAATLWGLERKKFRAAVQLSIMHNYNENKAFVGSVPIFRFLKNHEKDLLINSLTTMKFENKERIVTEGDSGDFMYIIKEGTVLCSREGREVREMGKGDFFGEQALLFSSPRTATITAQETVKCLVLSREKLAQVFGKNLLRVIYRNSMKMALEHSELLGKLATEQVTALIEAFNIVTYRKGGRMIKAGRTKGDSLWIVLYGAIQAQDTKFAVQEIIGDNELTNTGNSTFSYDFVACEDSDVAEISREDIELAIGAPLTSLHTGNEALLVLKSVQLFRTLPANKLLPLIAVLRLENYSQGQIIVQENEPGDCFFILRTGVVDVIKGGVSKRHLMKLDYFGERSVLFNEPRTATVVALQDMSCWKLYREDFLRLMDEGVITQLTKRIELQDDSIVLNDLVMVKSLGRGMFGNVFLVAHKDKYQLYALKTVQRKKIDAFNIHNSLLFERRILLEMDHNLILKLIRTFKDQDRLYFLMEYVMGLDLFDTLRILNLVTEPDSKFYTACLINIVEHLHERNIIYRDLKPENVMVDDEGYLKLIDFGTAKEIHGRTFTVIGTPHYMAPEAILGKGYGLAADYWSIGVMIFEFLYGRLPFGDNQEDPVMIYESVIRSKLVFPSNLRVSDEAKQVMERLMNKNTVLRTGGSIQHLKEHEWFNGFDWDQLSMRQLPAPYCHSRTDYTEEIRVSKTLGGGVRDVIKQEEEAYPFPENMRLRTGPHPTDWDQEF